MSTCLLILTLLSSFCASAQHSLRGIISNGVEPLPGVTVMLLDKDSAEVQGVLTDSTGGYRFADVRKGRYQVGASMMGYASFHSQWLEMANEDMVLAEIVLHESTTTLDEVEVSAGKLLVEQKMDRLVVNVSQSVTAAGNTILEVLQKAPGVTVNRQNNTLAINGRAGVRIMVNDKVMQAPLDVALQMLAGMSASNVESIELITTPPSKYDAEGNGGIIHIKTKESTDAGTNGTIGLTLGARWAEAMGGNLNLNHREKRFAYTVDYSITRDHNLHTLDVQQQTTAEGVALTSNIYSPRENITTQQNLSAGAEWMVTKNTTLNMLVTGYRRNWELNATSQEVNTAEALATDTIRTEIYERNNWQSATAAIGLQTKFSTASTLSVGVDYLYYHNNNPSQYTTLDDERDPQYNARVIDLSKTTPINIIVAHADYSMRLSPTLQADAGVKAITSHLDNDVTVQRYTNGTWVIDPAFTASSAIDEKIGAAYVSTQWHPSSQWQINGGLRYEYTHTSISTPAQHNLIDRKYGYFFPNLAIKRTLDADKEIQLSYAKRITRPTYNDIAPYVFLWGTSTFSAGNTALYPGISNAVTASYRVKQWTVALQYSRSRHEIAYMQPEADPESGALTLRSQNLASSSNVNLTNTLSVMPVPWWEMVGTVTLLYQEAESAHLQHNVQLHQYGVNVNVVNQVKLPKGFAIEISGTYQSTSLVGISRYLPYGSLNAGVQKSFGRMGTLRLAMDDILATSEWRIKSELPGDNFSSDFNYDWHNQYVRLSYTLNIGNSRLRALKVKSGAEEERGRVTN